METLKVHPIPCNDLGIDFTPPLRSDNGAATRYLMRMVEHPLGQEIDPTDMTHFLNVVKNIVESEVYVSPVTVPLMMEFICVDKKSNRLVNSDGTQYNIGPISHTQPIDPYITPPEDIIRRVGLFFYFKSQASIEELQERYGEEKFGGEGEMPKKWNMNTHM